MADSSIKVLPGFRDFIPQDCAIRNYLFESWRKVALSYGFFEYEAPILEYSSLYEKKTGEELQTQLFCFEDKGGREVTMRPELTASLARIVSKNHRHYPKPMKWFEIGPCFRYERQQKGRTREFIQFNADIVGESDVAADAELIALSIDTMKSLGFTENDFVVRVSDRKAWEVFCENRAIKNHAALLQVVDKMERGKPDAIEQKLVSLGTSLEEVQQFIESTESWSPSVLKIKENLEARGMADYIQIDLTIVRGLAYYTGIVFEIFDKSRSMRAIAGGGRYDKLLENLTGNSLDMPCTGFAMGDVVIRNFIEETPHALMQMEQCLQKLRMQDVFVLIADENQRNQGLEIVSKLRQLGMRVDFSLTPAKWNKQIKQANNQATKMVVILGEEFPLVNIKNLENHTEEAVTYNEHFDQLVAAKLRENSTSYLA